MYKKRSLTNHTKITIILLAIVSIALLALMLPLSACNVPTNIHASAPTATLPAPTEATVNPTATSAPTNIVTMIVQPTGTPTEITPTQVATPTQIPVGSAGQSAASVLVDVSGVAQDVTSQVVAAVPPSPGAPWWAAMPQYTLLTLQGYPIMDHLMKPQIFVYPVKDLGVNEVAGKVAESLQILLQNQQVGERMPYLPLYNAAQAMHAQVKYLDFKNGQGVRFLTWYSQGIMPINNHELLYTYQGLTNDGKYYVAAVLPVSLPGLPTNEYATENLPPDFSNNYLKYVANTVNMLDQQPVNAYTPDLSKLDAMMQSIEIK